MRFEKLAGAVVGAGLLLADCHGPGTKESQQTAESRKITSDETRRGETAKVAADRLSEEQIREICRKYGEIAAGLVWEMDPRAAVSGALSDERTTAEMKCLQNRGLARRTYGGSPVEMFERSPRGSITHTP